VVPHACAIDGVAGGEIVRAVEDDAARGDQGVELLALQALLEGTTFTSGLIFASASRPDAALGLPIDSVV